MLIHYLFTLRIVKHFTIRIKMYTINVTDPWSGKSKVFFPATKEEFETKNCTNIFTTPDQEYKVNGILHRENGPAKIWHDEEGSPINEYYTNGKLTRRTSLRTDTVYKDNEEIVKMTAYKNIDGVEIRGNTISVYKNDERISETFEPEETWKEAAEKRLESLGYRIRTLETELRQKSKLEEELAKAQKEQAELTTKLVYCAIGK